MGLPRPRGDRPEKRAAIREAEKSPPPTRGSTLLLMAPEHKSAVSPAHAGIDPPEPPCHPKPTRLPRPRGDRPFCAQVWFVACTSPPPTRGSTAGGRRHPLPVVVSPAHAGIDLGGRLERIAQRGLPRPRGDRPLVQKQTQTNSGSPPPTRGSTRSGQALAAAAYVSPAHAGIDLSSCPRSRSWRRLPRPRGDRPSQRRP